MPEDYFQDEIFDRREFTIVPLTKGEYENCTFKNCNFLENDLSDFKFIGCSFIGCHLSLLKLNKTAFQDIKFIESKMLGLRFDFCSDFNLSFSFNTCLLNHSSFYQTKIKKTIFKSSQLHEVDFSECDLTSSVFDRCDLTGSTFDKTILEKADLRTASNYSIDPENNRIKKTKFSLLGIPGLLNKYDIDIENNF